jgi:hypothetical protein
MEVNNQEKAMKWTGYERRGFSFRTGLVLAALFILNVPARAQQHLARTPDLATVRIKSHGASGTIIETAPGCSYILGCAHMLTDEQGRPSPAARAKPIVIDGPRQAHAPAILAEARLVAWDYELDLSLIRLANGPFYYLPVAPEGHRPSPNIWSCGYDEMRWPITKRQATLLSTDGRTTFTREKPWHGRSGGCLADADHRCVIGVVQGYEIRPGARGLYVSHQAVLAFLRRHRGQRMGERRPIAVPPLVPCPT